MRTTSNPILIKICGLKSQEMVQAAIRSGADFVGFMHVPQSPRHLELQAITALVQGMRDSHNHCRSVVVLVDPENLLIEAVINTVRPDLIQLHGRETPQRTAEISQLYSIPLIKAFGVAGPDDLAGLNDYASSCALFLFDAKPPKTAQITGGLGHRFKAGFLKDFISPRPWLLAGGLNPDNVNKAIAQALAPGVDVSSGVETAPGLKDPELIAAICQMVKAYNQDISRD